MIGACVPVPGEPTDIVSLGRHFPPHLEPLATFPSQPLTLAKTFVMELVGLLDDENVLIRETVKDALGVELNPRLFLTVLQQIEAYVVLYDAKSAVLTSRKGGSAG